MVLGLYYATRDRINGKGEGLVFADTGEVQRAWTLAKWNWPPGSPCA